MDRIVPVSEYWEDIERSKEKPFIGIVVRVPPRLWHVFRQVQNMLKEGDPTQLYTPCEVLHISLKGLGFLGEKFTDPQLASIFLDIQQALKEVKPFDISISGLDYFPTAIYAKVVDPYDILRNINYRLCEKLGERVEESQYDRENYIPHLTLATFTNKDVSRILDKVRSLEDYDFGSMVVFEIEAVSVDLYQAMASPNEREEAFKTVRVFHLGQPLKKK